MGCIEWDRVNDVTWVSQNKRLCIAVFNGQYEVYDISCRLKGHAGQKTVACNCEDFAQAERIASSYWLEQA